VNNFSADVMLLVIDGLSSQILKTTVLWYGLRVKNVFENSVRYCDLFSGFVGQISFTKLFISSSLSIAITSVL
jgi:hypothetical protein